MALHPGRVAPGRPCQGRTPGASRPMMLLDTRSRTNAIAVSHTLSKSAGRCSQRVVAVCDLRWHGREWPGEPSRTQLNETGNETTDPPEGLIGSLVGHHAALVATPDACSRSGRRSVRPRAGHHGRLPKAGEHSARGRGCTVAVAW